MPLLFYDRAQMKKNIKMLNVSAKCYNLLSVSMNVLLVQDAVTKAHHDLACAGRNREKNGRPYH